MYREDISLPLFILKVKIEILVWCVFLRFYPCSFCVIFIVYILFLIFVTYAIIYS